MNRNEIYNRVDELVHLIGFDFEILEQIIDFENETVNMTFSLKEFEFELPPIKETKPTEEQKAEIERLIRDKKIPF